MYCRTCRVILASIVLVLSFQVLVFAGDVKADFYVSPAGNNSWSGRLAAPNAERSDGPFAALSRARDAVRQLKKSSTAGGIIVLIRGGTYYLKETVVFGLADSGEGEHKVIYKNYPGEEPVFSSGVRITGWKKLKDYPGVLPAAARGKVWVADMPEGLGRFYTLYAGRQRLPRARSKGFNPVFSSGKEIRREDESVESRSVVRFPKGTLKSWPNLEDVELRVIPIPWMMNIVPLAWVDEEKCIARTAVQSSYRIDDVVRDWEETMWVENAIDFLDEPGEWVLNTQEKKIYLWPLGDRPDESIVAPCLKELVRIEGDINLDAPTDIPVRNLVFRGLTFTHGETDRFPKGHRGHGLMHDWEMYDRATALLRFRGAENCAVEECHFVNSGGTAIRLDLYCQKIRIANNLIEHVGNMGILLAGYGPGTKDVNKENEIVNNHIHHIGEVYWHGHGIMIWQSGSNQIAHNLIHDGPRKAIAVSGARAYSFDLKDNYHSHSESSKLIRWDEVRDALAGDNWKRFVPFMHSRNNLVEYNEIHHVMSKLGDGAALNVSGAGEGNIVRRNYIHDIYNPYFNAAMRTDGWQSGTLFAQNIIYKCDSGGITHKNLNHVENNFIIDVAGKRNSYIKFGSFPEDVRAEGSRVMKNIFYDSDTEGVFYKPVSKGETARPEDGYTDYNIFYSAGEPSKSEQFLKQQQKKGVEQHSISVDPLFVDIEKGDFRFKSNSLAMKLGIEPIDTSQIGLTDDFPKRFRNGK